jgi:predicted alpha/beta-hydrolase family hydrolase
LKPGFDIAILRQCYLRKSVSIDTVFQSGGKIGPPALLITTIGDSMQVPQKLKIAVENAGDVSALLLLPSDARACFVFGHGAGAGMAHRFMEATATGLCERGVASMRYQFPYMEQGSMPRCVPRWRKHRGAVRGCRFSPAASRSAGG